MKVVFTIADLQPESGGPTRSVVSLANAAAREGIEVELVTLEYGSQGAAPMVPGEAVRTTLVPCRGALAQKLKWSRAFSPTLLKHCQPATGLVLHDNGLWLPTNHCVAGVARATGIPLVISPRGMLATWALQFRGWKKKLAWWLYQRHDLQAASVLHATSHAEADGFHGLGLKHPIAIIPNGVELLPAPITDHRPRTSDVRTLLFLGRIHPVKGLLNLVNAWASARPKGWQVVLAGQNENGHQVAVQAAIRERQLQPDFTFVGPVDGAAKWDLYRSADLFILPSHTENFGLAVAEALSCGLPVITTRGTPWHELVERSCGWWVEAAAEPLADALRQATLLSDAERHAMGLRGRQLVEENYTWPAAAQKMISVYRWMVGLAEKPECVSMENTETLKC